jgi:23S rRNA pseudouridine1911/1915/1917 synthase
MMQDTISLHFDSAVQQRIDKYLSEAGLPQLYSRTFIEELIAANLVTVNKIPVKKSYLLKLGDKVEIKVPAPPPTHIQPRDIPLEIIYEDDYLAVINKTADLVVHPGFGNQDNTLVNALVHRYGNTLSPARAENRPGIVHRLDKGTSGLILVARDEMTQARLAEMFAQREINKTYLAVTTGVPEQEAGTIETCLARSKANPRKISVSQTGRKAITHYSVLQYYYYFALLSVTLETGRMHQIRVHLTHKNLPVLGDPLYNTTDFVKNSVPENLKKKVHELLTGHLTRQALHAWKISFTHPVTRVELSLTAPLPADLIYTIDWLDTYFAIDNVRFDKKLLN